jgi:cyclohexanecarboxyl-CoA dehydrogenase
MSTTEARPTPATLATAAPFGFTDEHELFRETMRAFARDKFASTYHARAQRREFPSAEYQLMVNQGLLGLTLPERLGGQGGDLMAYAIAMEELSWADVNLADLILLPTIAVLLLVDSDVPIASEIAEGVANGTRHIGLGLTEPGAGSDASNLRTRAEAVPHGWRLYGEKTSVTSAPHLDCAVVFATTRAGGSTAFLVELDADTVSRQRFNDPGLHPVARGSLTFDGTFVPAANQLSSEGRGFHQVMHLFDLSRSIIALMACGAAQRAIDITIDYVRERHAFGKAISNYQGVSFSLAECDTHLELTRTLAYRAIGLRMVGRPHSRQAAMVKWYGPQTAVQAIHECVILHGHYGWSEELPLQQLMRDVSSMEIADGTPHIQKLVIARRLLGRAAVE